MTRTSQRTGELRPLGFSSPSNGPCEAHPESMVRRAQNVPKANNRTVEFRSALVLHPTSPLPLAHTAQVQRSTPCPAIRRMGRARHMWFRHERTYRASCDCQLRARVVRCPAFAAHKHRDHRQAGDSAHTVAFVRKPPAAARHRHPHGAEAAGAQRCERHDIYTHVLEMSGGGVRSPLDNLVTLSGRC